MNHSYAIKVENLHKSFRLPSEQHSSLKQAVLNWHKKSYEELNILKGIDFEIKKGEFFGIVGRNGSGKSTLLKTIAGIYRPDQGAVHVNGTLTPFIELGIGFNPELTGRDNVFLNGAILGLSRTDIADKYEQIVSFAGLEGFMDQRLKNYSSGMQLRLAFSVAIQAQNEILLLDEVLAVGDENFQKKCVDYFASIKKSAEKTVILVTHDMGWVERFCDRAIVIHEGQVMDGPQKPHEAHMRYSRINQAVEGKKADKSPESKQQNRWGNGQYLVKSLKITQGKGKTPEIFSTGQPFQITVEFAAKSDTKKSENLLIGLAIYDESGGVIFGPNSHGHQIDPTSSKVTFSLPELTLNSGMYTISIGLFNQEETETFDFIDGIKEFKVLNQQTKTDRGKVITHGQWS